MIANKFSEHQISTINELIPINLEIEVVPNFKENLYLNFTSNKTQKSNLLKIKQAYIF